jgi:hypothetical protein
MLTFSKIKIHVQKKKICENVIVNIDRIVTRKKNDRRIIQLGNLFLSFQLMVDKQQ